MPKDGGQQALFTDGELQEAPTPLVTSAQEVWNRYADKNKWTRCNVLDKARRATITRAVGDYGGLIGWENSIKVVERSRFVMGKVPPREGTRFRQFKASIDWFCQVKTVRQVFEGFWEDDGGQDGIDNGPSFQQLLKAAAGVDWKKRLQRYKPGGFWHVDTEGPRPEQPGPHKAPAELIQQWRAYYKISEPIEETREERLAGLVAMHRKHGNYARANEVEAELASIEGRPPVLVPAPEVARHGMGRIDGRAFDEVLPMKPPPYRPQPRPSEAEATRAMAAAQDVEWTDVPEDEFGAYDDD